MDLQLKDRTAVVTGASRGIGLAIVRALVDEGMRVVAASRSGGPEIDGVITVKADLGTPDGPGELVERALAELGDIDLLVNNAGGGDGQIAMDFASTTDDQWEAIFSINLMSAVRATRAALPSLLRTKGSVISISSDSALTPQNGPIPYAAAKGALNVFSKSLAAQVGPQGVRVNTVTPSSTRTALWEGESGYGAQLASALGITQTQLLQGLPDQLGMMTGRLIEPEEIASVVAFLASPLSASTIGANFVVDAGAGRSL